MSRGQGQIGYGMCGQYGHTRGMENRIREIRNRKGLTLEQVAERAGTIASTIDKLEKGKRKLHIEWMRSLAKALEVTPADLLSDTDNPHRLKNENEAVLIDTFRNLRARWQTRLISRATLLYRAQEGLVTEAEVDAGLPRLPEADTPTRGKTTSKPRTRTSFSEGVE